jgi:hypothetical protein
MKHKMIILLCVVVAFVGCRPRGVLSNSEMRSILYDLHRADGAIQIAGHHYAHDQEVAGYYKNILDKHGVTQAEFDSSLVWYTNNPQIFNKIYPKVIERLEADYEKEKVIREQNRDRDKQLKEIKRNSKKAEKQIKELLENYRKTPENPWKIWKVAEFSEKNIIIFGQLEKK